MESGVKFLVLGAIPFIIDKTKKELRQFNRQEFAIPFDDLKLEGNNYTYQWKTIDHNQRGSIAAGNIPEKIINLTIPSLIIEDEKPMVKILIDALNALSLRKLWNFFIADESLAMRLSGQLPTIDLAGTNFTIDWRLRELRETEKPWNHLNFEHMKEARRGEGYKFLYDIKKHTIYQPDENLLNLPEDILLLEIPDEMKLDPVAVARDCGLGLTDLLIDFPFRMESTSKNIPLGESQLPDFIENNLKRLDGNDNKRSSKRGR